MSAAPAGNPAIDNTINMLMNQYSKGVTYGGDTLRVHGGKAILNNGFFGSAKVMVLSSLGPIIHEAPACIAAPAVTMVTKDVISLGIATQGDQPVPVRL